ncbi:RNA-binding protein NOB1 [Trypanosoma theileri]|uniref:RNA-binding protein NOB1 n=1 Tax=Trypanosoma theileri TaxID=67003 RepID=A0A1X0NEQ4_9TRYP|nr:RNA-binding protein NOB1 [Trypanosoma theileri]ORC81679.1 RNA-binding protein NOB1 [Trypanosoma theileri]
MSWAAVAQKAKDVTPSSTEPKRVVFAVTESSEDQEKTSSKSLYTTLGTAIPTYEKGLLILDANAFIKGTLNSFNEVTDVFVTTSQVIAEVRDRPARELLSQLQQKQRPQTLHVLEPSKESLAAVVAIAGKTGDLGAMSRTDIRICALALDCCTAANALLAPIEPRPAVINPGGTHGTDIVTEAVSDGEEEEEEEGEKKKDDDNNDEDDDDDEGGWITPENIHTCAADGTTMSGERFTGGVACVTSDYAMQNTLLHLGVPIVGPQGMRICELRHWLLRCTSCFAITTDTTRQFCSQCGSGNTLRRVQYVVTRDGERQLFINFKKTISTRGTVYNLPKPRGGRRGTNRSLVLREDQLAHVVRGTTSAKLKEKHVMHGIGGNDDDDLAAFGEAPKHHKRDPNQPRMFSSYHRYNVNEKKKARASRKK